MAPVSSLFLMFLISSFNPNTYHLYSITYPLVLGYSIALSNRLQLLPQKSLQFDEGPGDGGANAVCHHAGQGGNFAIAFALEKKKPDHGSLPRGQQGNRLS